MGSLEDQSSAGFALPLHRSERIVRGGGLASSMLPLMALSALVAPAGLLVAIAAGPETQASSPNSIALAQAALGIAIVVALVGLPLFGFLGRLGARRDVSIDEQEVRIVHRGLLRSSERSATVASYLGVAHVVRSSLDGTRHELVLAHADPRLDVVLLAESCIGQERIDAAVDLLRRPEIEARALLSRRFGLADRKRATSLAGATERCGVATG